MSMRKGYNFLCGVEYNDHDDVGSRSRSDDDWSTIAPSTDTTDETSADSSRDSNPPVFGVGVMNLTISLLYFCNQRPGIFVAPFLLLEEIPEENIGFVLFISGIIALTLQTPAGQLVDETSHQTRIVILGNVATMIGCILLSNITNIWAITLAVTITVVSDVFTYPSLYAITLGVFGSEGIEKQAPLNETGTHLGNACFAVLAGVIVVFAPVDVDARIIFYVCVAMRCLGVLVVVQWVVEYPIDVQKSRGLLSSDSCATMISQHDSSVHSDVASVATHGRLNSITPQTAPLEYGILLTDRSVIVFLVSVLLFHFANAAMLPLLSQQLFINNSDKGFAFAAAAVITAQVSMVCSATAAGRLVPKFGTKPLFLVALLAIPIRGVLIVLLLSSDGGVGWLLATQVLDGLAGGVMGVLVVLVTEQLARGSGRFALLLGLAKTAEGVGASFSNLIGEVMAGRLGYSTAFLFLSAASVMPLVLYGTCMPTGEGPVLNEKEREAGLAGGEGIVWRDVMSDTSRGRSEGGINRL